MTDISQSQHHWLGIHELPDVPFHEVYEGIYVGGHEFWPVKKLSASSETYRPDGSWSLVVSMYHTWDLYPPASTPHIVAPFKDSLDLGEREIGLATMAASAAWDHYMHVDEPKILFRCQAGMNRSSFVAALFLRLLGLSSDEAIATIRAKRSPKALFNPTFESYLRSLD